MNLFQVNDGTNTSSSRKHRQFSDWGTCTGNTVVCIRGTTCRSSITRPWSFQILAWQLAGMCVITGWTAALTGLMFGLLRLFGILRVPEEIEMKGKTICFLFVPSITFSFLSLLSSCITRFSSVFCCCFSRVNVKTMYQSGWHEEN